MRGRLEGIWIKRARRGPMDPVREAFTVRDQGLLGNANQGGKRQITVIEKEAFEAVSRELGQIVDPRARRANLLVSGISLQNGRGKLLRVGELRLRIWGETRPCERMDEAVPGLRRALEPAWRGGAFGTVLGDASIRLGDEVEWVSEGID